MRAFCFLASTLLLYRIALADDVLVVFPEVSAGDTIEQVLCSDLSAKAKGIAAAIHFSGWRATDYQELANEPRAKPSLHLIARWKLVSEFSYAKLLANQRESVELDREKLEQFFEAGKEGQFQIPIPWREWLINSKLQSNGFLNTLQSSEVPSSTNLVRVRSSDDGYHCLTDSKSYFLRLPNAEDFSVVASIESGNAIFLLWEDESCHHYCTKVTEAGLHWLKPVSIEWNEPRGSPLFIRLELNSDQTQLGIFGATSSSFSITKIEIANGQLLACFSSLFPRLAGSFRIRS